LQIAKDASPADMPVMEPSDPGGAKLGDQVKVTPDDTGRVPVAGELVASSAAKIVIRRSDPAVGTVMVHFPRAGYQVAPA
jgi:hypothetical protein